MVQPLPQKALALIAKISHHLFKIELITVFLLLTGLIIRKHSPEISEIVITVPVVTLALIYFFSGYSPIGEQNKWDEFYLKLKSYSMSIFCIGVGFMLNSWPGGDFVLNAATISIVLALFFSILEIVFLAKGSVIKKQDIIRLIVGLILVILFQFSPQAKLLKQNKEPELRKKASMSFEVTEVESQMATEFQIEAKQDIPADGKPHVVPISIYELPATYKYNVIPKLDQHAFLLANIGEYNQYDLLPGNTNLFFEGMFIG